MSRMFSLGCSFTQGAWMTAADVMGLSFEKHYNYGKSGGCNSLMMYRLMQIDKKLNLNSDDFFFIGVTGFGRFTLIEKDPIIDANKLVAAGDIIPGNPGHPKIMQIFSKEVFNINHGIFTSYIAIKYIKQFLDSKNIKHILYPAIDNNILLKAKSELVMSSESENLIYEINSLFDIKESLEEFTRENKFSPIKFKNGQVDAHPSIDANSAYIKKYFPTYHDVRVIKTIEEQKQQFIYTSQTEQSVCFQRNFVKKYRQYEEL